MHVLGGVRFGGTVEAPAMTLKSRYHRVPRIISGDKTDIGIQLEMHECENSHREHEVCRMWPETDIAWPDP
jgi:hypothetical protein